MFLKFTSSIITLAYPKLMPSTFALFEIKGSVVKSTPTRLHIVTYDSSAPAPRQHETLCTRILGRNVCFQPKSPGTHASIVTRSGYGPIYQCCSQRPSFLHGTVSRSYYRRG